MIISCTRRSDIPAFYSKWLMKRIQEGFCVVENPMFPERSYRVDLRREAVDCFVFWTKSVKGMLDSGCLELHTITPYGQDIEPGIPDNRQAMLALRDLSGIIGRERIVWRYDPIIFSDKMSAAWHLCQFRDMAEWLANYITTVVASIFRFLPACCRRPA